MSPAHDRKSALHYPKTVPADECAFQNSTCPRYEQRIGTGQGHRASGIANLA